MMRLLARLSRAWHSAEVEVLQKLIVEQTQLIDGLKLERLEARAAAKKALDALNAFLSETKR